MRRTVFILLAVLTTGLSGCEDSAAVINFNGTIVSLKTMERSCIVTIKTDNNFRVGVAKRNLNYCKDFQKGDKVSLSIVLRLSSLVPGDLEKIK